jgi:hypothetical protein
LRGLRRYKTILLLAGIFVALSALTYLVHYYIFQDPHHIFIYMVGDLAFLPLEAFLVVIVVERILTRREKQAMLQKLNMVIGAFFSEVGTELLRRLLHCFEERQEIAQNLSAAQNWTHAEFKQAMNYARAIKDKPDCLKINLDELRTFLMQKRTFLLALLENRNLLEHEYFTDLLWATFHLAEELETRPSVKDLPDSDIQHISVDIRRVYRHLAAEWVAYAEHLKSNYPFLFSHFVRMHPFQEKPSPVVKLQAETEEAPPAAF